VQLKRASLSEEGGREFWQAGKSVGGIHSVEPVHQIMASIEAALRGGGPRELSSNQEKGE